jgi:hypothetical protein
VLGVDISQKMRALAPDYVNSAAFSAVSRRVFQGLVDNGLRADAAICAWVLQHCLNPVEDIGLIRSALPQHALFGVVNNLGRAIPTVEAGWKSDHLDVRGLLRQTFTMASEGALDAAIVTPYVAQQTFWGVYQR